MICFDRININRVKCFSKLINKKGATFRLKNTTNDCKPLQEYCCVLAVVVSSISVHHPAPAAEVELKTVKTFSDWSDLDKHPMHAAHRSITH